MVDFHVVGDGPVLFDGTRLPFADRVFDACLLAFVLSYTDDPVALLREAGRVAAHRVLVLQSSPRGRSGRVTLWLRGWIQGGSHSGSARPSPDPALANAAAPTALCCRANGSVPLPTRRG